MAAFNLDEHKAFWDRLGYDEEPMGMFYSDEEPEEGFSPKPNQLPTAEDEKAGKVDWGQAFGNFSCVIGNIWLARKKQKAAYFSKERFGCMGGAFYLGFNKPQLDFIAHYVSTGIPGHVKGELYFDSFQACKEFFETMDPDPAPGKFCIFKPLSQFGPEESPEQVCMFARPEVMCGLHQLALFVTNDLEAVASPFGAGCSNLVTWPQLYRRQGKTRAVLGGWDPSCRKFLKTDELAISLPAGMYEDMVARWRESFLTTETWDSVGKKIVRSKKAWGEE